jgi:NAD(P)-dependent dehydrogenase (short-subunit alcohol dehydrogenase family)
MDLELKNKVAIVGGASKGLGRACAEALAQECAAMCAAGRADLERWRTSLNARRRGRFCFAGDLEQHDTIRALIVQPSNISTA